MRRFLILAAAALSISACSDNSSTGPAAPMGGYYVPAGRTDFGVYLYGDPAATSSGAYFVRRDSAGVVNFDFGSYAIANNAITFTPGGAGLFGARKLTGATWTSRPNTFTVTDAALGNLTLQWAGEFWPEGTRK